MTTENDEQSWKQTMYKLEDKNKYLGKLELFSNLNKKLNCPPQPFLLDEDE